MSRAAVPIRVTGMFRRVVRRPTLTLASRGQTPATYLQYPQASIGFLDSRRGPGTSVLLTVSVSPRHCC